MACKILHLNHSCRLWWSNSRLAWFLICCGRWWSKAAWMWWKFLSSNAEWHQSKVWQKRVLKMGIGLKIHHCCVCIHCNQMAVISVLLLSLKFTNDMEKDIDSTHLEIPEARNSSSACTHHVSFRHSNSSKLVRLMNKEALDQLEAWQNLWAFPMWYEAAWIPKRFD